MTRPVPYLLTQFFLVSQSVSLSVHRSKDIRLLLPLESSRMINDVETTLMTGLPTDGLLCHRERYNFPERIDPKVDVCFDAPQEVRRLPR